MRISIHTDGNLLGQAAAAQGAAILRHALKQRGAANLVLATGASQFSVLAYLAAEPEIDWEHVTLFHLDEYLGIQASHPASFRRYLQERFVARLPGSLASVHWILGDSTDPAAECQRLNHLILAHPVDVAFIGIGENGHLAFNDPPADFETTEPYIQVNLDLACRMQQMGEGWFPRLENVPQQAISMSIHQILKSQHLICSVPELRKAKPVLGAVTGPITPKLPASILQKHDSVTLFLDSESSSLLPSDLPSRKQ